MDATNQRKKGVILSYVSIAVGILMQLLYTPFLTRMLGQSEYGLYSLIASVIGYLVVLDFGFGNAIVVYTAKYREQKKYEDEKKLHGMFFAIYAVIGIIVTILGIILFLNVEKIFGSSLTPLELSKAKIMMLILTFNLSITFFFNIYSSIIVAYEKFIFQRIMSIISNLIRPIIMIPLLFLGFKSITMTVVITITNIVLLLANYFFCKNKLKIKIKFKGFDKKLFKTVFGYSFFIFISVIVGQINFKVDQFILGAVSGTIAVSIYSIASHFVTLFTNIGQSFSGVMLPKLSKMVARKASDNELIQECIKVGRLNWYILLLGLTGFIIFGSQFINIWVGPEYKTAYYIGLILLIPLAFTRVQSEISLVTQAKNKHRFKALLLLAAAIINVIISIPLAREYGGIGSAIGTFISIVVCDVFILNIYYNNVVHLNMKTFWSNIIKISLPIIIPFFIMLYLTKNVIILNNILGIAFFAALYTIIYFIMIYNFSFNQYEKNIVNNFLKKLKRNK